MYSREVEEGVGVILGWQQQRTSRWMTLHPTLTLSPTKVTGLISIQQLSECHLQALPLCLMCVLCLVGFI